MTKQCTKCGETKHLHNFHKEKGGKYGVKSQCKKCMNEYHAQYRENNAENRRAGAARAYGKYQERSMGFSTVPPGTPWTPDEDALLMALDGLTIAEKAERLGRTYAASHARRKKLLKRNRA